MGHSKEEDMFGTTAISEDTIALPATLAFRIHGRVTSDDMKAMAERVLEAFDTHEKIDLLLIFDRFEGSDAGAGMNIPSIKAQTSSVWNVRAYVVAGAPDDAAEMIETFGKVLPIDAETFATEEEARTYLASLPRLE